MKKTFFRSLLVFLPFLLCSCYNMRTNVNQPASEATFWEKTQRTILFAHDCRQSPEECTILCKMDRRDLDRHFVRNSAGWNSFKYTILSKPFIPSGLGVPDKINYLFACLAEQFGMEVLGNLIEHSDDIIAYNTFVEDKNTLRSNLNLTEEEAIAKTWSVWYRIYGYNRCLRLKQSLGFIRNMQANVQFSRALSKVFWTIMWITPRETMEAVYVILLVTSPNSWRSAASGVRDGQTEAMAELIYRSSQLGIGAVQSAFELSKVIWGLYFLEELSAEHAEERRNIEAALVNVDTGIL